MRYASPAYLIEDIQIIRVEVCLGSAQAVLYSFFNYYVFPYSNDLK